MAKRKSNKKTNKRNSRKKAEAVEQSAFWPLAGAIILMVAAVFIFIGGFNAGGPLPQGLFDATKWLFGWTAYFVPVALVFFGLAKFKSDDKRVPLGKFISMIAALVFTSSWFFVTFASRDVLGNFSASQGGESGRLVGGTVLNAIDKWPAGLMFFVFALLAYFYAFSVSPQVLTKLAELFKRHQEDTDLAALKQKMSQKDFKLNEGVPVEHSGPEKATSLAGLKVAASKAGGEAHTALTVASDPDWKFPSIELLNQKQDKANAGDVNANAQAIKDTFSTFNMEVDMEGANIGPRVTQYTLKPPAGVKLTKMAALENNLALDLAAQSIRVEAPIPGKKAVGIEVPNVKPATVRVSSIFDSSEWQDAKSPLSIAIGKDITGHSIVGVLDRMPHLLVAGQTNSGKSVMINTILTSLLYRNSPSDLKLILVDPKHVELLPYNDIPHLLSSVITEPEKCISALKWAVAEMERRYKTLSEARKRNIIEYNQQKQDEGMPYIVIVIDELADLMMMAARDVEALIVRIAQKARAVGIHLVIATQRPSVDIVTGLIKANIPARIAFTTTSQVDSRTIIDGIGAEKLLGMGDMLFTTAEMPKPKRIQGALVESDEVQKITDFLRSQRPPNYDDEIISQPVQLHGRGNIMSDTDSTDEPIFRDAVRVVVEARKASTSLLQRRLRIGYGKAARLIESMEEQGIIGPADGSRPREVLVGSVEEVFAAHQQASTDKQEDDVYDEIPDE